MPYSLPLPPRRASGQTMNDYYPNRRERNDLSDHPRQRSLSRRHLWDQIHGSNPQSTEKALVVAPQSQDSPRTQSREQSRSRSFGRHFHHEPNQRKQGRESMPFSRKHQMENDFLEDCGIYMSYPGKADSTQAQVSSPEPGRSIRTSQQDAGQALPSQPAETRAEQKVFDAVHDPSRSSKDISIQLHVPIEQDLAPDLENFCRFRRLGKFKEARDLYETKLAQHNTIPYILIHYAEMLVVSGDYKGFQELVYPENNHEQGSKSSEADKIKTNFELLKLLAHSQTWNYTTVAMEIVRGALEDLKKEQVMGSTEVQLLSLCLQILSNLKTSSHRQVVAQATKDAKGAFDLERLYYILLGEARIWDFKDLLVSSVALFGWSETMAMLFRSTNSNDTLARIYDDWSQADDDESMMLGLLDVFTSLMLQTRPLDRASQSLSSSLVEHARVLAESAQKANADNMNTRPFIQWILVKALSETRPASKRRDGATVDDFHGLLLDQGDDIQLPVFVPIDHSEKPDWSMVSARASVAQRNAVEVALGAAMQADDFYLQALALKILCLQSQDPIRFMDILSTLQLDIQGDWDGFLCTSLARYLVPHGPAEADEKSVLRSLKQLDNATGGSYLHPGANPSLLWARDAIQSQVLANVTGVQAHKPSWERNLRIYGSRLPQYIATFIEDNFHLKISDPMRVTFNFVGDQNTQQLDANSPLVKANHGRDANLSFVNYDDHLTASRERYEATRRSYSQSTPFTRDYEQRYPPSIIEANNPVRNGRSLSRESHGDGRRDERIVPRSWLKSGSESDEPPSIRPFMVREGANTIIRNRRPDEMAFRNYGLSNGGVHHDESYRVTVGNGDETVRITMRDSTNRQRAESHPMNNNGPSNSVPDGERDYIHPDMMARQDGYGNDSWFPHPPPPDTRLRRSNTDSSDAPPMGHHRRPFRRVSTSPLANSSGFHSKQAVPKPEENNPSGVPALATDKIQHLAKSAIRMQNRSRSRSSKASPVGLPRRVLRVHRGGEWPRNTGDDQGEPSNGQAVLGRDLSQGAISGDGGKPQSKRQGNWDAMTKTASNEDRGHDDQHDSSPGESERESGAEDPAQDMGTANGIREFVRPPAPSRRCTVEPAEDTEEEHGSRPDATSDGRRHSTQSSPSKHDNVVQNGHEETSGIPQADHEKRDSMEEGNKTATKERTVTTQWIETWDKERQCSVWLPVETVERDSS